VLGQGLGGGFLLLSAPHGLAGRRGRHDSTWRVAFTTDGGPVSYFSYPRQTGVGRLLFVDKRDLLERELCTMELVAFPFFTVRRFES
jgi:hypothetical protein